MLQKIVLVCILGVVITASLWHLEDSPRTWFDEGIYLNVAKNTASQGIYNIVLAPGIMGDMSYISTGYTLLLPIALAMKVFGPTLLVARLVMVGFLVGLVLLVFLYIRRISGVWPALLSAGLLATFSALYGHGKNVLGEVPGLFYLVFAVLLFAYAECDGRKNTFYGAALFFGLAVATKPIFIVCLPGVIVAYLLLYKRNLISLKSIGISTSFLILPIFVWVILQLSFAPIAGVFSHYVNPYNEASVVHNILPNVLRFFTELTPIHCMLLAIFVGFVVWRKWRQVQVSEWILLSFSILVLASFLRTPGWYRYFFPAHVIFMILAPVALARLNLTGRFRGLSIGIIAVLIIVQGVYLVTHIDRFNSAEWRELRDFIESRANEGILYYNVPQGAFFSPKENYYQILTIREGLAYGQDLASDSSPFNIIISGGGNDPGYVKKLFPSFEESRHIGGYYIYYRN